MGRWPYTFGALIAGGIGLTALMTSYLLDMPVKDPDGFLGPAYIRLPVMGLIFFAADIFPRAIKYKAPGNYFNRISALLRDQWSWMRVANVIAGLLVFYVSYVGYRNLKSFLPIVREEVLLDDKLMVLDYLIFLGNYPAVLFHDWFGVGFLAQFLSVIYISYLILIPVSLAAMLVWKTDVSLGAWYSTALALNWILGVFSYYLVPSLGPTYIAPQMFQDLPVSGVTALQQSLFEARIDFLADPTESDRIHGIAGFASLHVSVVFTAALFFTRIGANRLLRYFLWVYLMLTGIATMYFGWHYFADVLAGLLIGWLAVGISAWASGNQGFHALKRKGSAANAP